MTTLRHAKCRATLYCALSAVILRVGNSAPCIAPQGTSGFDSSGWADKYVREYGTTVAVECHTSGGITLAGIWRIDDSNVVEWAALAPEQAEKRNCKFCDYPNNDYLYCDPLVDDLVMCIGATLNPDYVPADGFAGQDCESWRHLSLYMEGLEILADLEEVCRSSASSGRGLAGGVRRSLTPQRYDFNAVVGPEGGAWADKPSTEYKFE
jgi:hypothetical protein